MENFGKFIDDIRKEVKWINIHFNEEPFGESMTITIPPSTKKYVVDTTKIGKIEYGTPMYLELLEMTLEQLRMFNQNVVIHRHGKLNIKNNIMNAIEAREKIKDIKLNKHNELEKIYGKITEAVDFGWHNTFISEFNISIENKNILESEGYFVDTRYTNGFQVRWLETDINYFLYLIKSNKEHAKLKVDDDVIENYKRSACV